MLDWPKTMEFLSRRHFHHALGLYATAWASDWPAFKWPVSNPRALGLDEHVLANFDADIAAGKYGYVDSMLVIRHGSVAFDRTYTHDYDKIYGADAKKSAPLTLTNSAALTTTSIPGGTLIIGAETYPLYSPYRRPSRP